VGLGPVSRQTKNKRRARPAVRRTRLKFFVDHNVRAEVGDLLEGSGFHTRRTYQEGLGELEDREVAAYAAAEDLIVVTHDRAFYNRLFRSSQRAVLLRVTESHARRRLKETLPALTSALRTGRCAVRVLEEEVIIDRFERTR
jgi:predicted nuclease of predicted toxin-antitoxin system